MAISWMSRGSHYIWCRSYGRGLGAPRRQLHSRLESSHLRSTVANKHLDSSKFEHSIARAQWLWRVLESAFGVYRQSTSRARTSLATMLARLGQLGQMRFLAWGRCQVLTTSGGPIWLDWNWYLGAELYMLGQECAFLRRKPAGGIRLVGLHSRIETLIRPYKLYTRSRLSVDLDLNERWSTSSKPIAWVPYSWSCCDDVSDTVDSYRYPVL